MAANREERFLMRQRGAGTRRIQDFGFDIALPGVSRSPLKPIRSGRSQQTPQPQSSQQRSLRRTPKSTPSLFKQTLRPISSASHSQNKGRPSRGDRQAAEQGSSSQPTRSDNFGSVTKKRKLANAPQALQQPLLQTPTARPVTNAPPSGVPETELQLSITDKQQGSGSGRVVGNESAQDLSIRDTSSKKRRKKRKSIVQVIRKRPSLGPARSAPQQSAPQQAVISPPILSDSDQLLSQAPDDSAQPGRSNQLPITSPQEKVTRKTKRKKRVSIGKLPKHRKKPVEQLQTVPTSRESNSSPLAEVQNESRKGSRLPSKKTRESTRNQLPVVDEEEELRDEVGLENGDKDEDVDHSSKSRGTNVSLEGLKKHRPRVSLRGSDRAPAKDLGLTTGSKSATIENPQMRRSFKRTLASIPITVHRLSGIQEPNDEDLLGGAAPFPKKVGVNAIDVLSQICREIIEKTIDTIQKGADNESNDQSRAELNRKKNCVEMFGNELDGRLFQMTEALDNDYALKFRLRQANKEKASAREELLKLRREREEIALQIDEVRAKHERSSKIARDEDNLNTLIQDVKLAVQRSRALEAVPNSHASIEEKRISDIEFSLRQVGRMASSANGPGLLHQVKSFNSFLEKTVASL